MRKKNKLKLDDIQYIEIEKNRIEAIFRHTENIDEPKILFSISGYGTSKAKAKKSLFKSLEKSYAIIYETMLKLAHEKIKK